ncbi:MAG: adenylate kinase [Chlorobiaceae bacterium]|nr:adenylate kinase [Chlorobiaceae bacterium]MBA4310979.1 adenylate kinase [Chlorobiaceae bacterium]
MFLIVFGAPGVGKGTQAKILSERLNIPHISTGDILRQAVADASELGLKAKKIMDSGELVPDSLMISLIKENFSNPKSAKGFILDGFPRTVAQAASLDNLMNELKMNNVLIIYLTANEDEIVKRLTQRLACSECKSIFSLSEIIEPDVCPNCGALNGLYHRNDDKEDVIRNRIEVFKSATLPVLNYFELNNKKIFEIDGLGAIEDIAVEILDAVEKFAKEKVVT